MTIDDGKGGQIEVFTADEMAAKETALNEAKAEAEKYKQVSIEKTENFKKLHEMTEKEKEQYTEKELEARRMAEIATERAEALEKKYKEDTENRAKAIRESEITRLSGGDVKLKEEIEKNWGLINLEGTDETTIKQRADMAFKMAVGSGAVPNPLNREHGGDAPRHKEKEDSEKFLGSDRGKAAWEKMKGNA